MRTQRGSGLTVLAVALATSLAGACGGDKTTEPETGIVGSWLATSLTAPTQPSWGDAVSDYGLSMHLTFDNSGGYSVSVSNDDPADGWWCFSTASCSYSGTYSVSGHTITFDGGSSAEEAATYSFSGSKLTIAFTASSAEPDPYRIVLQKN